MRWKLIKLFALLVTVTTGQIVTIEEQQVHSLNLTVETHDLPLDGLRNHNTSEDSAEEQSKYEEDSNTTYTNSESKSTETSKNEEIPSHIATSEDKSDSQELNEQPGGKPESDEITRPKPSSNENPRSESKESKAQSVENITLSSSGESSNSSSSDGSTETIFDGSLVQTSHGPLRGIQWKGRTDIIGYIDIPYGKINMPFEAPVTAQSWLDVHKVTKHTKHCPQIKDGEYIGDINCLTLSIFTPANKVNASVLFYIHDDYSKITSADPSIYGPEHLVSNGVILVLPNYRLGPMGFLCLQNETAPGNAGLKDLSLALEWVKENIKTFGGNPKNIAVGGDGAAGAYASYLALYSRSKYYIDKVIADSGTALSYWALDRDPIGKAYELADKIRKDYCEGIIFNNTFQEASLETIIKAAKDMRFNPCLERDKEPFMDDTPWEILHDNEFDTTFMIGSAEYAGTHEAVHTSEHFIHNLNNNFEDILPDDLMFTNNEEKMEFGKKMKSQYFGNETITLDHLTEISLWHTDSSYLSPAIRLARKLVAAGAVVYFYEFAFVGNLNKELESMNKPVPGAVRSDMLGYLFHKDGTEVGENTPEKHMINLLVDLWVTFINSGKPTAKIIRWNRLKRVKASEEEWLLIDSETQLKKGLHVDRLQLWTDLYNQHYIEGNSALRRKPHYYVPFVVSLMCWIANTELNYSFE